MSTSEATRDKKERHDSPTGPATHETESAFQHNLIRGLSGIDDRGVGIVAVHLHALRQGVNPSHNHADTRGITASSLA